MHKKHLTIITIIIAAIAVIITISAFKTNKAVINYNIQPELIGEINDAKFIEVTIDVLKETEVTQWIKN